MDAARAAAETGLCARLRPTGEIEFNPASTAREAGDAEGALEKWIREDEAGRRA